jgi:hypothetical protein
MAAHTRPKPVFSPCSKCDSPFDVRTALDKLFENPKFRNAVEQALRVLK